MRHVQDQLNALVDDVCGSQPKEKIEKSAKIWPRVAVGSNSFSSP